MVDYDDRQYAVYAKGRALHPDAARLWAETFARWAPPHRPLDVLDLGSGTGRFSPLLAGLFGGTVHAVEPSARMRQVASETAPHERVVYRAGSADHIPLPAASCDLALLFLSFHHFPDRARAAAELARVLRPGGRVLFRSAFGDRIPDLLWHRYFPSARAVEQRMFPALADVLAVCAAAGLRQAGFERLREPIAAGLREYAGRIRLRAISTFEYLDDAETAAGIARLDAAAAAETDPTPVTADADLLILERGD
ncbi:class I SAM-dependent methyltransferase [Dactylosporangium sp. AC04546]|uniref:class I SAM-dependent methyltransferase n=1 Tax=Dactylosporangium sp. AC04546 TaxID=2862460 RepID=UPI001EDD93EA|nr:class I SAM-dependent methyltransferase [Dactylosporangium sp. AC04546]WVK88049.1 class I SAM-dependent methyltransferase [Dactylosporangium sp. AC04546]